jgi:cell division septation protein DedD
MLLRKESILLVLIMILVFPAISHANSVSFSGSDSLLNGVSQDENILYNMINDMRRLAKMSPIPFSASLSIVAHAHINDLIITKPQENGCSLHSWSTSGKWTACCNTKDPAGILCMKSKPKEITGYPGNGYELIYWGEDNATPADAAALWQKVDASSDMILCRGKWKNYQWKALGVGIQGGYAVLWLGDKADVPHKENQPLVEKAVTKEPIVSKPVTKETKATKTHAEDMPKEIVLDEEVRSQVVDNSAPKYYLIVGSVKTPEAAKPELKRIKAKGYPNAYILEGESVYRITIESFDNNKQASKRLFELKQDFPGIWIFKK